jgi:hypothetical protein
MAIQMMPNGTQEARDTRPILLISLPHNLETTITINASKISSTLLQTNLIIQTGGISWYNDGSEYGIWGVLEKRCDKLQGQKYNNRQNNVRDCSFAASHVIHSWSRKW